MSFSITASTRWPGAVSGDSSLVWQDGQPDILYTFWTDVTGTLAEEFHRATEGEVNTDACLMDKLRLPAHIL